MNYQSNPADAVRAPHVPLTDYYADEASRPAFVRRMFDTTAQDYDRMETILGLGSGSWYRGQALERAGLREGMRVVDVGAGTGLVAREAARICGNPANVTGVDPSVGMMAHAKVPEGVHMVEGVAEAIPSPDAHFDFLSMGYALRHLSDLDALRAAGFTDVKRHIEVKGMSILAEYQATKPATTSTLAG